MGDLSRYANQDMRTLLGTLGVGQISSTLIIRYMFMLPATTDLQSAPVVELIKALQRQLIRMGAPLRVTGDMDVPTADCLERLVGANWQSVPWAQVVQTVISAVEHDVDLSPRATAPAMGYVPDLPLLPGGILGWAIAGGAAYFFLRNRKR